MRRSLRAPHPLIAYVAGTHDVALDLLLARSRHPHISEVRALCCWLLYHHWSLGLSEIGRLLGVDHSSVSYAVDRVQRDARLLHDARETLASLRDLAESSLYDYAARRAEA